MSHVIMISMHGHTPTDSDDKPRRWFRFTLRTLLFAMLAGGCLLGLLIAKLREVRLHAQRQSLAAKAITDMGGAVMYDYDWNSQLGRGEPTSPGVWNPVVALLLGDEAARAATVVDLEIARGPVQLSELRRLTRLHTLSLASTSVVDGELAHLRQCSSLRALDLTFASRITDSGLAHLAEIRTLEHLTLHGTTVTDDGLAYLRSLTRLQYLDLQDTGITDRGLEVVADLKSLRYLNVDGRGLTDAGFEHLKGMNNLRHLYAGDTALSNHGLEQLGNLIRLERLWLNGTRVTDDGLEHVGQMSELRLLSLSDTNTTDAGLAHLTGLRNLRELNLEGTRVTAEGAAKLRMALPQCVIRHESMPRER